MIDLRKTLNLIKGGILDAEQTWQSYLAEAGDWQKTVFLLTGPLILFAAVAGYVFGFVGADTSFFAMPRPTIVSTIASTIMAVLGAGVVAFIFAAVAGALGGKNNFPLALAATSFAFIPGYLSPAISWLPWIGGLLGLGLFIYGLVLLWRVLPTYLGVPEDKRASHFGLSLVASIAAMIVITMTIGRVLMPSMSGPGFAGISDSGRPGSTGDTGMFGGIARQAEIMSAAEEDRFDPPSDGRVTDRQIREFVRVLARTSEMQDEKAKQLKELAEKMDKNENVSLRDMSTMMSGVTEIAGMQTAEMEVVKSGGGNWAEHQWVRESLRTARIQKDLNETVAHNYKLYQEYEAELSDYLSY